MDQYNQPYYPVYYPPPPSPYNEGGYLGNDMKQLRTDLEELKQQLSGNKRKITEEDQENTEKLKDAYAYIDDLKKNLQHKDIHIDKLKDRLQELNKLLYVTETKIEKKNNLINALDITIKGKSLRIRQMTDLLETNLPINSEITKCCSLYVDKVDILRHVQNCRFAWCISCDVSFEKNSKESEYHIKHRYIRMRCCGESILLSEKDTHYKSCVNR